MKNIVEKLNKDQVVEVLNLLKDIGYSVKYLDDPLGQVGLEISGNDGCGYMIHQSGMTSTFEPYKQ